MRALDMTTARQLESLRSLSAQLATAEWVVDRLRRVQGRAAWSLRHMRSLRAAETDLLLLRTQARQLSCEVKR